MLTRLNGRHKKSADQIASGATVLVEGSFPEKVPVPGWSGLCSIEIPNQFPRLDLRLDVLFAENRVPVDERGPQSHSPTDR